MEKSIRDDLFIQEIGDPERLAVHFKRLIDLLDARLDQDEKHLVYILAQPTRFGHLVAEPWLVRAMYGSQYKSIVIVTGRGHRSANPVFFQYLKTQFTVIEVTDSVLLTMGFLNTGGFSSGPYDVMLFNPQRLFSDYTAAMAAGMPRYPYMVSEQVAAAARSYRATVLPDPDIPYVVMHVRGPGFMPSMTHHEFRYSPIDSYREAVELLLSRGHAVFRIGDPADDPLQIDHPLYVEAMRDPAIIRTHDFGLIAGARFGIATSSGPNCMFLALDKPFVHTNAYFDKDWAFFDFELGIFKHFFDEDGHELSYREICQRWIGKPHTSDALEAEGLRVESNSSEEIFGAIEEMLDILDNGAPADWEIQRQFREITRETNPAVRGKAADDRSAPRWQRRLSRRFLEINPGFLN